MRLFLVALILLILVGIASAGSYSINGTTYDITWDGRVIPSSQIIYGSNDDTILVQQFTPATAFTVGNDTIYINNNFTSFKRDKFKVSPVMTFPKTLLASRMINYNTTVGYLVFPYSLSRVKDYISENEIRMGNWTFRAGQEHIDIYDDNETQNILPESAYTFKIVDDEIRLYFLKAEANKLLGNITFEMKSWEINETSSYNLNEEGTYTFTSDILCEATCITVLSNNIVIEGAGYTITFANTSTGKGITNTGYDNVSIYNLTINQGNLSTITNRGIEYLSGANDGKIQNVTVNVNNTNSYGLLLSASHNNTLISNNLTANSSSALYLFLSHNNTIVSNTATSITWVGLFLSSSNNNNFTSNTFNTNSTTATIEDIVIDNSGRNNTFINTDFTTKARKIEFNDALISEFNQSQDGGISFISTNLSLSKTTNRSIVNWNQSNITFTETFTGANQANYSGTGLFANTNYQIWNGTTIDYNLTSNSNGVLSDFTINFTTTVKTIKILKVAGEEEGDFIPPSPINLTNTTGNFWANHSVEHGIGNITDSLNKSVSVNGSVLTWTNNTAMYLNTTASSHATVESCFYSFNNTGIMNTTGLCQNTTIPNNVPVMTAIGAKSGNEGDWINFSITGTDLDDDSLTCSGNNTKGTLSNCNFNWSTGYSDPGVYNWIFYLNDSYGGSDSEIVTITVDDSNLTSYQDYVFDSVGTYYVTVNATNANGTSQTLNWTISVGISEALAQFSKVEFLWWE